MDESAIRSYFSLMLGLLPQGVRRYSPFVAYFTGYPYGTLYDWDQYFEGIVQLYAGWPCDYLKNGIKIFLSRQEADGFIGRSVPEGGGPTYYKHRTQIKPFLAQECLLCYQAEGTLDWLKNENRYDRLKKYLTYWLTSMDVSRSGLSVWREAEHTGMDNHYERAGQWGKEEFFCEGVDLNCYLVRELNAMVLVSELLNFPEDGRYFREEAGRKKDVIRKLLWNEEDAIFYDRHAVRKEAIKVKYVGAFLPLWAGVADERQARLLVEKHLTNPGEFWRTYPIPALAASEPGYVEGFPEGHSTGCCSWRAHTWLPTNYMIFHGLRDYGYHALALDLAQRSFKMFRRGQFSEYYTSESGIGTGQKPFWGWSCLAFFMEAEAEYGVNPTRLALNIDDMRLLRERLIHE